ncbi:MAG: 5'-nucleotidase C-terminal domain-containing protein [Crocinitomicaceae bacterium]|nr:5'-nucleotidase C-terminal domain-containing protein [Crocinitomicaceae bacterium]
MKNTFIVLAIIAVFSCQKSRVVVMQSRTVSVNASIQENQQLQLFLIPFQDSLKQSMNQVLSYSLENLERQQPEGKLGNFTVDLLRNAIIERGVFDAGKFPVLAILNNGGLRSPILAGDVTVGSVFKLMPFDNEVVFMRLPFTVLPALHEVLISKGGEPISGGSVNHESIQLSDTAAMRQDSIWLITSDYLAQGNDGFEALRKFEYQSAQILLRELLLEEIAKKDTIRTTIDGRWNLNKAE